MVADTGSLLEGAGRLRPDLAVVDLSLAQDSGLGWLRSLHACCPELKVIVVSVHDEQSVRLAALAAGADAFVLKRVIVSDLLPAVERVCHARGDGRASPDDDERGSERETGSGP